MLAAWESYYVIVGTSAAALTGLQFVVMALVADTPGLGSADSVDAFGTPTIVHFSISLFVAALLSAPWASLTPVLWILVGAGIEDTDGRFHRGCTGENATYGLTIGAERVAVVEAVAVGGGKCRGGAVAAGPDVRPAPGGGCGPWAILRSNHGTGGRGLR